MSSPPRRLTPKKQVRFEEDVNYASFSPPFNNRLSFVSGSSGSPPVSLPSLSPPTPIHVGLTPIATPADLPGGASPDFPPTPVIPTIPLPPTTPIPALIPLPPSPEQFYVLLHTILSVDALCWDMSESVSNALYNNRSLSPQVFQESATNPPQTKMIIAVARLPWVAIITSREVGSPVTIFDVLEGIFRFLRTPVMDAEISSLPEATYRRARDCFRQRSRRDVPTYDQERQTGMRRIDLLLGYHQWGGLVLSDEGDSWQLIMADG